MSNSNNLSVWALIAALAFTSPLLSSACSNGRKSYPTTEKRPLTEEYFGKKIEDDYQWLNNLDDPKVKEWNTVQNAYTRAYLDSIPYRMQVKQRLTELHNAETTRYYSPIFRKKLFAIKRQPSKNQPFLVVLDSPDDIGSERVLVDPAALDPKGTTAIDWYVPTRDGRLIAVSLSENGSEDGSVSIFEVSTGKRMMDIVPRVQFPTGGGSLEWNPEGTGFYYTRYPQGSERPAEDINFYQQIYYHTLGTTSDRDRYVIGKEFPKIAECKIASTEDGKHILISVANGDGGDFEHYLGNSAGKWAQITQFTDKVADAQFGLDDTLYLLRRKDAPNGMILSLRPENPQLDQAKVVIPEGGASIVEFHSTTGFLFVVQMAGGPYKVLVFDLSGKEQPPLSLNSNSSIGGMTPIGGDRILYETQSYLDPPEWFCYDGATKEAKRAILPDSFSITFDGIEMHREFATSQDGTKVPLNILMKSGTQLSGQNPTILYGYGGFGISESPYFDPVKLVWLEQGGIYVISNIRGGGEFGEAWHEAGKLTEKQNVFDDFIACAQFLIDKKYTNPKRLAIEGGSNGGLLVGAALTQHPELFRAVVGYVGLYDMLHFEDFPNGVFNVTEYGTVKDPEQFKALYSYSPYHHVEEGKSYPAVIFLTGDHDGRVDPANSRKMTARLQAASDSGLPVLLRTNPRTGHGIGTGLADRISQQTDVYSFLFDQLQVPYSSMQAK